MTLTADNIRLIYNWYSRAMRREGFPVTPPKDTEFEKTYHYRSAYQFAKKMVDLGFSDDTIRTIVNSVVRHGKKYKLLRSKGTNILNIGTVVDVCLEDLQKRQKASEEIVEAIRRGRQFLVDHELETVDSLAQPARLGGTPRLGYLLETGDIPVAYLAVSRTAAMALDRIADRARYPSDQDLMRLRARLIFDGSTRERLKQLLGTDLNTAGLPRSVAC